MHHSPETISARCITPQRQNAQQGVKIKLFACLWLLLKWQSARSPFRSEHIYYERTDLKYKYWYTKNIFWTPRCATHCRDNFVIEYLGEMETEFENTFTCLSEAQMGSNHEKNWGPKSRDTLPLRGPKQHVAPSALPQLLFIICNTTHD